MASAKKTSNTQTKREERDLQAYRDIADDVIESDFVPYACFYDGDTLLTKDGELLQTIKITGLGFDGAAAAGQPLRAAIRQAIAEAVPDASYGIWLHTLRRQQGPGARTHFPDAFSGQLDEAWRQGQPASAAFANELYITISKAGKPLNLRARGTLTQTLIPSRLHRMQDEAFAEMRGELGRATQTMLDQLARYGAKRLGLVEREGVFYSEQLEFLEKLINLEQRPMALVERDLSHELTSGEITFGFNAMEVRTSEGHRRFAALLTVKEYKESTLGGIDKFLEIPCELIATQCFSFLEAGEAQESYAKQARLLHFSGDKELAQWMEIDRLSNNPNATFGQQQTTLFLIAPSVKQLEANVKMVQRALSRLGMVVVREDLRMEECYWAQLPGNFTFVARTRAVNTEHLAGFANLQAAPAGNAAGSAWGPPVTQFQTLQDMPYYFNFHREGSGHTVVLGKSGSGRTSFTHFLLAQARKLPVNIWYLDSRGRSKALIEAMGGQYLTPGTASLKLNPFHLPETQANQEFLALWLSTLIDPYGLKLNRATLSFFQGLVAELLARPKQERRLSNLLPMAREADPMLGAALEPFCLGGKYGDLFDMPDDQFRVGTLVAWDVSRFMGEPETRIPLMSYLLHVMTGALDGTPTLIAMDEGFTLFDTPLFSGRAAGWCDYLTSKNAAWLISAQSAETSGMLSHSAAMAQKAATIFAFPDPEPDAEYGMAFGFTAEEMATLAYLKPDSHQVLQKRGQEVLVLRLDFAGFNDLQRVTLSGAPRQSAADALAALMGYGAPAA